MHDNPRDNHRLNVTIEKFISNWDGTDIGQAVKNMYENGSSYESICDCMNIDYEEYKED